MEQILAVEEEHADDLLSLLADLEPQSPAPGPGPLGGGTSTA
jgi:hypothetical protein